MVKRAKSIQHIEKLDNVITFGKYRDSTFEEVLQKDASYLDWAIGENVLSATDQIKDILYDYLTY